MPWRLNLYFSKIFAYCFLAVLALIAMGSFLITLGETFNRNFSKFQPSGAELIMLAAYHVPDHLQTLMPLTLLLAAIGFFLYIALSQQLLIAWQTGVSTIRLLILPIILTLLLGIATITLLNPVAANLLGRAENLINRHNGGQKSLLRLADTGVWLRQNFDNTRLIVHARQLNPDRRSFTQVSVFEYHDSIFTRRIEAQYAIIQGNQWEMHNVLIYSAEGLQQSYPIYRLLTYINQERIDDSFTSVSAVSIWELSDFINMIENAGFDAKQHRNHFHSLLATPVVMLAMFLLSCGICARAHHRKSPHMLVLVSVGIGLGYFVFLTTFQSLGLFHEWPTLLTIWLPHLLFLMFVFSYIVHQDNPSP